MLGAISRYGRTRARRPGPAVRLEESASAAVATAVGPAAAGTGAPPVSRSSSVDTGLLAVTVGLRGGGHLLGDEVARFLGGRVGVRLTAEHLGQHVLERVGRCLDGGPALVVGGDLGVGR